MATSKFQELLRIRKGAVLAFQNEKSACALCPDMGGRVFGEVCGRSLHRIDLDTVPPSPKGLRWASCRPDQPFANFGGGNFWPAPEGGKFGFNYRLNEWYVQPCINAEPFLVGALNDRAAVLQKQIALVNRAGTKVETRMQRAFRLIPKPPLGLQRYHLEGFLSYQTTDTFTVLNKVPVDAALLASWTLEQFEGTGQTISFCAVVHPEQAINFDFYEHPSERIAYAPQGFTYKTDARRKGQIGIRQAAGARFIGFYDLSRRLVCVRENCSVAGGLYFNIADNDQPQGPASAADNYSIFNSDADMGAFELETIGSAQVEQKWLKGSELISITTFAIFENPRDLQGFMDETLGRAPTAAAAE
ncbi:MAG: hypothetical protein KKD76_00015 [Verrucomicrobia bacterium]|nr:hypothetical protein [Verrucomicrobiota bacterium]